MDEGGILSWWREKGHRLVNSELVSLAGNGIGYAPLKNLLYDFIEPSPGQIESLVPVMREDGARIKRGCYAGGGEGWLIYIR